MIQFFFNDFLWTFLRYFIVLIFFWFLSFFFTSFSLKRFLIITIWFWSKLRFRTSFLVILEKLQTKHFIHRSQPKAVFSLCGLLPFIFLTYFALFFWEHNSLELRNFFFQISFKWLIFSFFIFFLSFKGFLAKNLFFLAFFFCLL